MNVESKPAPKSLRRLRVDPPTINIVRRGPVAPPVRRPPRPRKALVPAYIDDLARFWPGRNGRALTIGPVRDDPVVPGALEPYAGARPLTLTPPRSFYRAPEPAPRGPAEIEAWLARHGIRLYATGGGGLGWSSDDSGRIDPDVFNAVRASLRLLAPYKHGTPLRCEMPNHTGGEPPLAVTLSLTSGWCGECQPPTS